MIGKQEGEDIEESGDLSAFSYNFKDELKITTTKKENTHGEEQQEEEDFDRNDDEESIENLDVAINEVVEIK